MKAHSRVICNIRDDKVREKLDPQLYAMLGTEILER